MRQHTNYQILTLSRKLESRFSIACVSTLAWVLCSILLTNLTLFITPAISLWMLAQSTLSSVAVLKLA